MKKNLNLSIQNIMQPMIQEKNQNILSKSTDNIIDGVNSNEIINMNQLSTDRK
jgi:hypothetical protein